MSSSVVKTDVSAQTLEHVLATGDLSKLTVQQRVEYYAQVCRTVGLNPLTRPFRFLVFQGQTQMYATRDCADQLRKLHNISLQVVNQHADGDVFVVTVRAKTPDGRQDEDMGAVTLGRLMGDGRANALMKAMTKAKRRVTLSICGLGMLSEDELDTMPGAQTFSADDRPAAPPQTLTDRERINRDVPFDPPANTTTRPTLRAWLDDFEQRCNAAQTEDEANAILKEEQVLKLDDPTVTINDAARARALRVRSAMVDRIWPHEPVDQVA